MFHSNSFLLACVTIEADWWRDKRGAQVPIRLQSVKPPVDYKLFDKHYDPDFQWLLAAHKCKLFYNCYPRLRIPNARASVTLSVAHGAAAWFALSCNGDCNRFILSVIQSIVYTVHNIYRRVYFMFTYRVNVWKYAVINYWPYYQSGYCRSKKKCCATKMLSRSVFNVIFWIYKISKSVGKPHKMWGKLHDQQCGS